MRLEKHAYLEQYVVQEELPDESPYHYYVEAWGDTANQAVRRLREELVKLQQYIAQKIQNIDSLLQQENSNAKKEDN